MNQAFKDLYIEIEEDEVEALLLQFDEDGNGQLEEDEFVRMALEAKNGPQPGHAMALLQMNLLPWSYPLARATGRGWRRVNESGRFTV